MDLPKRKDDESAAAYYQRLLALQVALAPALRQAKAEASDEVNEAELKRRFERDLAKAKENSGSTSQPAE